MYLQRELRESGSLARDIAEHSVPSPQAIWSYVGYSNLMYAMGEVKAPVRTIKIAGPLAIGVVTVLYLLTQVAYFAAVPREDILGSTQIIASLYFQNMFGASAAKALSVFVALSAVANVFSVIFSQGRLNQALGRDHLVPFSKILASNRPFNAPLAGLTWHVIVTLIILLAPPSGDVSAGEEGRLAYILLTPRDSSAGLQLCPQLVIIPAQRGQRCRLARIAGYLHSYSISTDVGYRLVASFQGYASGDSVLYARLVLLGGRPLDPS